MVKRRVKTRNKEEGRGGRADLDGVINTRRENSAFVGEGSETNLDIGDGESVVGKIAEGRRDLLLEVVGDEADGRGGEREVVVGVSSRARLNATRIFLPATEQLDGSNAAGS